jgi:catechol 2,3-dioxygenase-like lactoylglutathione lyase family enzyme
MLLKNASVVAILPAADLERAQAFYSEKLGLPPANEVAPATVSIECGNGTMFILYEREGGTKAEHTVAGWLVDDVEETVEALDARGVVFEQYDMPGLKTDERGMATLGDAQTAWFKDSEGNILSITEPAG